MDNLISNAFNRAKEVQQRVERNGSLSFSVNPKRYMETILAMVYLQGVVDGRTAAEDLKDEKNTD